MVLKHGPVTLPLDPTPMGPLVDTGDRPEAPLGWILNLAVTGHMDLRGALVRGEAVIAHEVSVRRPEAGDDLRLLSAWWRGIGGGELGEDAYIVEFVNQEIAVPRATLVGLLDELERLRAAAPKPPGPWLFRPDPQWHTPAPGEEEALRPLEARAAALDRSGAGEAERPALLRDLDAHGLFADSFSPQKAEWLERWGLPLLAGYARATADMHLYLRSDARRRHVPSAGRQPILGAPISIEWFRRPTVPAGFDRDDWLGWCEHALRDAPSTDGPEGEVFVHAGPLRCHVLWRRDDGRTPAIVRTELV